MTKSKTTKNVAIIRPDCNILPRAFYNSQELGLAIELAKLGVNVDVYYAGNVDTVTYEVISQFDSSTVRLVQLPFINLPLIGQGFYPSLTQELKKNSYNLIQVNEYNDIINYVAIRYAHKIGIPCIIYQGMYKNLVGRINQLYTFIHDKFLLPAVINKVTAVYTKTTRAAQFLTHKGFQNPAVLPVGLDPRPFENDTPNNLLTKDSLGIPQQNTVATYIGNFEERRNIKLLLKIANKLREENFSFVMVGAGELFEYATQFKQEHRLDNLTILKRIPQQELSQIYSLSDLFLLASNYEIYGMVLIEAMYHSVVPISNISAGSESLITSGENGVLIDSLELDTWAETLLTLSQDPEKLNLMKRNACEKIKQSLTWNKVAQYYFDEILLKHGAES